MRQKYAKKYFKVNALIMSLGDVLAYYPCEDLTYEALDELQEGDTLELHDYIPLVRITPHNAA